MKSIGRTSPHRISVSAARTCSAVGSVFNCGVSAQVVAGQGAGWGGVGVWKAIDPISRSDRAREIGGAHDPSGGVGAGVPERGRLAR
jgi:hypothetical protein